MNPARRIPEVVDRALRAGDGALLSLRDRMTPGQRWTAALAATLALAVLVFGAPVQHVTLRGVGSGSTSSASTASPAPTVGHAATSQPDTDAPGSARSRSSPLTASQAPGSTAGGSGAATSPVAAVPVTPVPTPAPGPIDVDVLAVVAPASPTGRSEADVARVFADASRVSIVVVEHDPGAGSGPCATIAGRAQLVVLGEGFDRALVDCLVGAGVAVVAFSADGDRPPRTGRTGQVVSTRRGFTDSVVELARWGLVDGALDGRVGLVAPPDRRSDVNVLVPSLRALGVDLVAVAHPSDDPGAVSEGARRFVEQDVEVVLLATSMSVQQRWAAQHGLLDADVRFAVADVADAVEDEDYPPTFDGSVALTTLRASWFTRAHGATEEQERCRTRWEAAVTPATVLGADELRWVHSWCQHVAVVEAAVSTVGDGVGLAEALRRQRIASPLTSDLGPLSGGGWGPTADAVLVWRAGCGCWAEQRPFRARAVS